MLKFGKRTNKELGIFERLELLAIKLRVVTILIFFKTVKIRKDNIEYSVIYELRMWAKENGIKFEIKEENVPIYIKTHHLLYELNETRYCKFLFFSK